MENRQLTPLQVKQVIELIMRKWMKTPAVHNEIREFYQELDQLKPSRKLLHQLVDRLEVRLLDTLTGHLDKPWEV